MVQRKKNNLRKNHQNSHSERVGTTGEQGRVSRDGWVGGWGGHSEGKKTFKSPLPLAVTKGGKEMMSEDDVVSRHTAQLRSHAEIISSALTINTILGGA